MTDRNPSDLKIMEEVEELTSEELLDEELTDEELLAINGGGIGALGGAIGGAGTSILTNTFNGEPINWRSAAAGGVGGAVGGAIGGAFAGPWGASLAGAD